MRNRILAFIIIFIFLFSMMISPAFAAPPNPNHTITVNGSGFDGTGKVDFDLLKDGQFVQSVTGFDGTSHVISSLDSGNYSINITGVTEDYEASVSPQSVKLVGREKSETFTITLSGGVISDKEIASVETLSDINVDYGTEVNQISLPETVEVTLDDNSTTSLGVNWDTANYDGQTAGTYTLTGDLVLVEGIANTGGHTASVNVIVAEEVFVDKEIASVETLSDINVDYGTEVNQISLPETVEVTLDDNSTTSLGVNWDTANYDGQTAGTYTLTGDLVLVEGIANTGGHTATVDVIVAEEVVVETVHYLALGDSIATGTTGISGTMYSYAYQFRDYLEISYGEGNVTFSNLAVDGDDALDLYNRLISDNIFIAEVTNADIITLSIGGNNIMDAARDDSFWSIDEGIAEVGTSSFELYYPQIISRIRELNGTAKIISSTLYNPYNSANHPTGYSADDELHDIGQIYIGRINTAILEISESNYEIADVHTAFYSYGLDGNMGNITFFYPRYSWWTWWYMKLTRDPHPNQTGQDLIRQIHEDAFQNLISYSTLSLAV